MIRERVGKRTVVSSGMIAASGGEVAALVRERMAVEVAEFVDGFAEDVFVCSHSADAGLDVETFEAVWAPDPMVRGVELRNGPHDGVILRLPRGHGQAGAFPRYWIVLPHTPHTVADWADPPALEESVKTAKYRRAGIDPVARRFVYEFAG